MVQYECLSMSVCSYANRSQCLCERRKSGISFSQFCAFYVPPAHAFLHPMEWHACRRCNIQLLPSYRSVQSYLDGRLWLWTYRVAASNLCLPFDQRWPIIISFLFCINYFDMLVFLSSFPSVSSKAHTQLQFFSQKRFFHFNCSLQTSQNIRLIAT